MASETFERTLTVAADPRRCWQVLTDVSLLASWVGIVHEVKQISTLEKYTAVLQDRLGPFKLRAVLDIAVEVVEDGRHVRVRAVGQDRQVNSRISVDGVLKIGTAPGPGAAGACVEVTGEYRVEGKVASMGSGVIRKKASTIIEEFFSHAETELTTGR